MQKLFVYGTLQQPKVQMKVFGRTVDLHSDVLRGFKKGEVEIDGTIYPIAIPETGSTINGKVLEATAKEIKMMDVYETAAYRRIKVKLESGLYTWVYCQP